MDTFCATTDSFCTRAEVASEIYRYSLDDAINFLRAGPIPDDRFGTLRQWK